MSRMKMRVATAFLLLATLLGCGLKGPFAFLITGVPHELDVRQNVEAYDGSNTTTPWTAQDPIPVAQFPETAVLAADRIYVLAGGTAGGFRFDPSAAQGAQWQT